MKNVKLYFRLLWKNYVSRIAIISYTAGVVLSCYFPYSDKSFIQVVQHIISMLLTCSGTILFGLTKVGLHSYREYKTFVNAHNSGTKSIFSWKDSVYPCTRAALKLAKQDILKLKS